MGIASLKNTKGRTQKSIVLITYTEVRGGFLKKMKRLPEWRRVGGECWEVDSGG
jgi:hypothetical protein